MLYPAELQARSLLLLILSLTELPWYLLRWKWGFFTVPNFVPTQPLDRRQNRVLGRVNVAGRDRNGTVPGDTRQRPHVAT